MDLLGDLGTQDQLTAARAEIRVLQEKVKELTGRVKVLTVENESLKAEVEIYRQEAALPSFSKLALGVSPEADTGNATSNANEDLFVRAGQGVYATMNEMTWTNVHGSSNPLAVALSPDDTVVASGGADGCLRLVFASSPVLSADTTARLDLGAPVISVAFAKQSRSLRHVLACGCMDGSAYCLQYAVENVEGRSVLRIVQHTPLSHKHTKYVKTLGWSTTDGVLATASADGTIHLYKITGDGLDPVTLVNRYKVTLVESLHLQTPVEAIAFTADQQLLCYARNTPHIACFDINDNMKQSKVNLNRASQSTSGGFDEHVSMAVMDLQVGSHACWLAATDAARNFVLDPRSQRIVRNLYGHANDGYSQPKVAWASPLTNSGSYVFGNTQDESVVCVWDVASAKLVDKLKGHAAPIRDLDCSQTSDTLVTTAFDKSTRVWYPSSSMSDS